jgi:hypothetical protein
MLVAILAFVAACAIHSASDSRAPVADRALAGCYALRPGPWQTDSALSRLYNVRLIPTRLRLRTEHYTRNGEWEIEPNDTLPLYQVDTYPEPGQGGTTFTTWQRIRVGSDTIHVGQHSGLTRLGLTLSSATQGTLAGWIYRSTDYSPDGRPTSASAAIVADRISCSAVGTPPGD